MKILRETNYFHPATYIGTAIIIELIKFEQVTTKEYGTKEVAICNITTHDEVYPEAKIFGTVLIETIREVSTHTDARIAGILEKSGKAWVLRPIPKYSSNPLVLWVEKVE